MCRCIKCLTAKRLFQRLKCRIVVVGGRQIRLHEFFRFALRQRLSQEPRTDLHDSVHRKLSVCNRSRLIQTQGIYMRQCFQRINILNEDLHFCQPDDSGRQ